MSLMHDFIIVGQGIAGTTLAWQLLRRGMRTLVIDRNCGDGASHIAAGLITAVTGKRLAKSWRWDELYPRAVAFYRTIEAQLHQPLLHVRPAVRLFINDAELAEFHRRSAGVLRDLVQPSAEVNPAWFHDSLGGFAITAAGRLDVPRYLDASREHFRQHAAYHIAELDLTRDLQLLEDGVCLPRLGLAARAIVLCRGFSHDPDPWFGSIRFNAAKGEILTLRIPGFHETRVVHRGIWLAPVGNEIYRVGSTYTWEPLNCEPTAIGRAEIEQRLREFLRIPYEVIDHRAAVRPVIDAGFPVLGRHPDHPQLAYFNGLGSKGSLLAPFFADQLANILTEPRQPEREVDVRRFLIPKSLANG